MRTIWRFVAPLSVLGVFGLACSSSGGGGGAVSCADGGVCPTGQQCGQDGFCFTPGGTGGGGGSGGSTAGGCQAACTKAASANCPNGSAQSCTTNCQDTRNKNPNCTAEFDSFLGCLTTSGTPTCKDGEPELEDNSGACQSQLNAYVACLQGGTGGGGTGGFGGGTGGGDTGGFGGTGGGFGGTGGGVGGSPGCTTTLLGLDCSVFDLSDPCDACLNSNCCSSWTACFANNDCAGLYECVATNCATAPDTNACANQYCSACLTETAIQYFNSYATCGFGSGSTPGACNSQCTG